VCIRQIYNTSVHGNPMPDYYMTIANTHRLLYDCCMTFVRIMQKIDYCMTSVWLLHELCTIATDCCMITAWLLHATHRLMHDYCMTAVWHPQNNAWLLYDCCMTPTDYCMTSTDYCVTTARLLHDTHRLLHDYCITSKDYLSMRSQGCENVQPWTKGPTKSQAGQALETVK
jgi:hypothetical protein